jgi:hypothetical protein
MIALLIGLGLALLGIGASIIITQGQSSWIPQVPWLGWTLLGIGVLALIAGTWLRRYRKEKSRGAFAGQKTSGPASPATLVGSIRDIGAGANVRIGSDVTGIQKREPVPKEEPQLECRSLVERSCRFPEEVDELVGLGDTHYMCI